MTREGEGDGGEDARGQEGPRWNTSGCKWFEDSGGGFMTRASTVQNGGERGKEARTCLRTGLEMGGEESQIRWAIRARMLRQGVQSSGEGKREAVAAGGVTRGHRGSRWR